MYAVRTDGRVLADRYATWAEAVEAAQEGLALPAASDWQVVLIAPDGYFVCHGQPQNL